MPPSSRPTARHVRPSSPTARRSRRRPSGRRHSPRAPGSRSDPARRHTPVAPNSASGTAPRTIVITPCDAPMISVNATTSGRLLVPASNRSSAGGRIPVAIRPTVIALKFRAKRISTTRPPNCATPFREATQTAAAVANPAASSTGTSWTEITPNTNAFSDMMRANSAMAIDRVVPSSGGPSGVATGAPVGPPLSVRLTSRETEPVQRQADSQIDQCERDEGLPPAQPFVQRMTEQPEHRRGERPEQRQIGDRLPPARRRDLHQGGERGVVQAEPHADAQERPDDKVGRFAAHLRQREEAEGHQGGAERHHGSRASAVDRATHGTRDEAHDEQRHGEAEEDEPAAPARVPTDRAGEDSEAVEARPPRRDLREAEREDGAHHGVAEPRAPSGARVRAGCGTHEARRVTTARAASDDVLGAVIPLLLWSPAAVTARASALSRMR